jgi:ribosome-binding ATPase YchF (GTP1/OBG family)
MSKSIRNLTMGAGIGS